MNRAARTVDHTAMAVMNGHLHDPAIRGFS